MHRLLLVLALAIGGLCVRTAVLDRRVAQAAEPVPGAWRNLGDLHYDALPLDAVLADVARLSGVKIAVDWTALAKWGVSRSSPITLRLFDARFSQVAALLERQLSSAQDRAPVAFTLDGDHALLTLSGVAAPMVLRAYDVRDFVPAGGAPFDESTLEEEADLLVHLVEEIDSDSWATYNPPTSHGGASATVDYHFGYLWVKQTPANHYRIADWLRKLRRLRQPASRQGHVELVKSVWGTP